MKRKKTKIFLKGLKKNDDAGISRSTPLLCLTIFYFVGFFINFLLQVKSAIGSC